VQFARRLFSKESGFVSNFILAAGKIFLPERLKNNLKVFVQLGIFDQELAVL